MIKYYNTDIVFQEIPGEVTLAINLTRCPFKCKGCHSPHLQQDIGEELDFFKIKELIKENQLGISCVLFLGGDADYKEIDKLIGGLQLLSDILPLKYAWYSGQNKIPQDIHLDWFDYIKIGPYMEECGGLNNPKTNQRLYKIEHVKDDDGWVIDNKLIDITNKFWKNEE